MNITICDDCQIDIDEINSLCKSYADNNKVSFNVIQETNPLKLDLGRTDLLFLDIRMPGKNGIDIQRNLEIVSGKPLIVFITNYHEFIYYSHGTNVIGFLEKPVSKMLFNNLMDRAITILSSGKVVSFGTDAVFNTRQIQYIVMENGVSKAILSTGKKSEGVFKSIKQWNEELQDCWFIRINQSCLVNCQYIESLNNGKFILKSGESLNSSRREKRHCEERYMQYLEYHARFL